jgi:hypothetical protein
MNSVITGAKSNPLTHAGGSYFGTSLSFLDVTRQDLSGTEGRDVVDQKVQSRMDRKALRVCVCDHKQCLVHGSRLKPSLNHAITCVGLGHHQVPDRTNYRNRAYTHHTDIWCLQIVASCSRKLPPSLRYQNEASEW